MAIGRITGSVLKSNLTRNGVDLAFETNLLYLDVTNSRVGIGTSEPTTTLDVNGTVTASAITGLSSATITNTSTDDSILVTTTEDSSSAGPVITLKRNSASPADADYMGQIKFKGENDADQEVVYAKITGKIQDASDGTEDGIIEFANRKAGSNTITARLRSDSLQLLNGTSLTVAGDTTITGSLTADGLSYPTADGSNGQVLTTDGSGNLSFSESSGGGGGNNTAVKQFNYFKLNTTSSVIDEFEISEFRGALYTIDIDDTVNNMIGNVKVSVVHDDSTVYISTYDINEDSTRIVDFTAAISGTKIQISAATNVSTHTNLRIYRVALGDHHETVANTNTKIIKTTTAITSSATTLDQFTATDIRAANYIVLIKDATQGDYSIQELNIVHDGTTAYHTAFGVVSSRGVVSPVTFSASISSGTVTLSAATNLGTTPTAILYRTDLGSKTKLGEYDNVLYGKIGDVDSAVKNIDRFDVFKYRSAKYLLAIENSDNSAYQISDITMTINSAGTDATISESVVRSGTYDLAVFTADVSGGRARLRMAGSPANNVVYFARKAVEADNIYRANADTTNNLYVSYDNLELEPGAIRLPKGTTAARPSSAVTGMIRYNTTTDTYERYDTTGWTDIATTATSTESSDTTTGETTSIGTSAKNIDTFTTGTLDSAFYLAVTKDEINDEIAAQQISLVHNDSDAFVSAGGGVQSGSNDHVTFTADINAGTVRLRGTGTSVVNSIKFFRIGLGDSTSASSSGNTATVLNADVDSAVEDLDTWAHATYRGAKYYISANNSTKTELQNIECLVVHNGSDAFITSYNDNYTGNNPLISLTADISGANVRLRASGNEPNTAVKMYRVLLGDSESDSSSDNTKTVGQTTTSSSATTMDTFSSSSYNCAHYVVVGNSTSEGAASISEVFVVTDGSDAYVASGPIVSTKGSDQLSFTASLSGTTVTVSSASTSGASTTVNAYRVQLNRTSAGAATSEQVLTSTTQTITGTKTFTQPLTLTVGSDPATVADNAHIYAKDVTASAEVFVRDEAGNVTQISPHNKEGDWVYYSENVKTGKRVKVNMEKMIRRLEEITGETFFEEYYDPSKQ